MSFRVERALRGFSPIRHRPPNTMDYLRWQISTIGDLVPLCTRQKRSPQNSCRTCTATSLPDDYISDDVINLKCLKSEKFLLH